MNDQRSLSDQLSDLIMLADKAGMYDAANYIRSVLEQRIPVGTKVVLKECPEQGYGVVVPNYKRVVEWKSGAAKGQKLTYSYEDLEVL